MNLMAGCGDEDCGNSSCERLSDGGIDALDARDGGWVSGRLRYLISGDGLTGATVTVYRLSDDAAIASVIATDGTYSLPMPTDAFGHISGYIGAKLSSYTDSYAFFNTAVPAATASSQTDAILMLTTSAMGNLYSTLGITQDSMNGLIEARIGINAASGVAGATLNMCGTGMLAYGNPPSMTATSTLDDGVVWVFNASAGSMNVDVTQPAGWHVGFDPRRVKVFPGALSTTQFVAYPDGDVPLTCQ